MAQFPDNEYQPRTLQNISGRTYNPGDLSTVFAEDINSANAEIVAIEQAVKDIIENPPSGNGYVLIDLSSQIVENNRVFTLPFEVSPDNLELHYTSAPFFLYDDDFAIITTTLTISEEAPAPEVGQKLKLLCSPLS